MKGKSGSRQLERVKGIEPSSRAWEAFVLPLNYTRGNLHFTQLPERRANRLAIHGDPKKNP